MLNHLTADDSIVPHQQEVGDLMQAFRFCAEHREGIHGF
jgi:hypothetical protein